MATAAQLALAHDSELVVMHAWSLPAVAFAGEYLYPPELVQQTAVDAQTELDAAVAQARASLPRVSSALLPGPAAGAIAEVAKDDPAIDLVVLGTHGRTGLRRVLLGSVAESVVRHAACAVLAVRPDQPAAPFHHVLCPVDFSVESAAAVELAADLVEPGGQGITLVHVVEPPVAWGEVRPFDLDHEVVRHAAARLGEWADQLSARGPVQVSKRVRVGRPGAELLAALEADASVDLVVMGNRGRTGLTRLALGSVAEKLVRYAHCPVLVTHGARASDDPSSRHESAA